MMETFENKVKFLEEYATFIGEVCEYRFYEHPTLGDESPLIMITPFGNVRISEWCELPTRNEMIDWFRVNRGGTCHD